MQGVFSTRGNRQKSRRQGEFSAALRREKGAKRFSGEMRERLARAAVVWYNMDKITHIILGGFLWEAMLS